MAKVCDAKVCQAQTEPCNECESIKPKACGKGGLHILKDDCGAIYFTGITDVTVRQGTAIDLTDGVHAYDGNGVEIPFTVEPSNIDTSVVGDYEVIYTAEGASSEMIPSYCGGKAKLHMLDCGMKTKRVTRNITVIEYAPPTCFVKGTKVWTYDGLVNIEDISAGDSVLAYNDLTEENEYAEVLNTIGSEATDVYELVTSEGTLEVTADHRMYLPQEQTYKAVKDLKQGDVLLRQDGADGIVWSAEPLDGTFQVFNLEVDALSNYYVGEVGYLTYNMNISGKIRLSPKSFRSANTTHSFDVACLQSGADAEFSYHIIPLNDAPPLNNSVDNVFTFSLTGETAATLNLSVNISEDGIYEYQVTPENVPQPCRPAPQSYRLELHIIGGSLADVFIYDPNERKQSGMIFTPSCDDPYDPLG